MGECSIYSLLLDYSFWPEWWPCYFSDLSQECPVQCSSFKPVIYILHLASSLMSSFCKWSNCLFSIMFLNVLIFVVFIICIFFFNLYPYYVHMLLYTYHFYIFLLLIAMQILILLFYETYFSRYSVCVLYVCIGTRFVL